MWQTFGHESVKNILDKQLQSGSLSHAYFFSGPEGLGKKMLAVEFARKILSRGQSGEINLHAHPDFMMLDTEGEITMEQMRGFISRLDFKPFVADYKVAVINNAHLLNTQSSNALLKTLEEPSEHTVIILVAASAGLLSTIVSRCQCFSFNPFSTRSMKDFAESRKLKLSEDLLNLSFGSPGRLSRFHEDPAFGKQQRELVQKLHSLQRTGSAERLAAIADLAEMESDELEKIFKTWLLAHKQGLVQSADRFLTLQYLSDALAGLKANRNKKLVLQSLLLNM